MLSEMNQFSIHFTFSKPKYYFLPILLLLVLILLFLAHFTFLYQFYFFIPILLFLVLPICSRAAKPPFLLPKNCVKMRMIFFVCWAASIVLRIQLCDCDVTYRWRNLASYLFNFLTKKIGIHQCYQL